MSGDQSISETPSRISRDQFEEASDLIEDPVVLEFLGLEEKPAYSETDLESAIIDRLQRLCRVPSKRGLTDQLARVRLEIEGRKGGSDV